MVKLNQSDQEVSETYNVVVDYSKSLDEMVKAGDYQSHDFGFGYINNKWFPLQGIGQQKVELVMIHLNRDATFKEVLEHLDNLGLEPAKIEHLLAFNATYPEIHRKFSIVAPGSLFISLNRCRHCFRLHRYYDGKRELDSVWIDSREPWSDPWNDNIRCLAVRKLKAA